MHPRFTAAREHLARLVAFDTTSVKTNIPCIEYIEHVLNGYGVASERVPAADGLKASLFATIGPGGDGGIGLSGHTDVVPVAGQAWTSDPFTLTERDGKLYGRGTCDMKGFLACMLTMVPDFVARRASEPVHLIFSYDEEVGCTGVRPLISELGTRLPRPRVIVVGEPTTMTVVDAHKGASRFRTTLTGREAHSSMAHLGVNAIHFAGMLISELVAIEHELRSGPQNDRFTPSYTTLQIGLIEGGRAQNIVPRMCAFSWEVRVLPGIDPMSVLNRFSEHAKRVSLPAMRQVAHDASIETALINGVPAYYSGEGSDAVSLALNITGENMTYAVSYGTEAGLFQAGGCPSVICGPGDIAQAHTPDEWILPGELERCLVVLGRLAASIT